MNLEIPWWIDTFRKTPGAFSVSEALALYHAVKDNMDINIFHHVAIDLGSNIGKSSIPAIVALSELGYEDFFYMCDPIFEPLNIKHPGCYWLDDPNFEKKTDAVLKILAPNVKTDTIGMYSTIFLKEYAGRFNYIMIDSGEHLMPLLEQEMFYIEKMVVPGTLLFLHDCGAQYVAPYEMYNKLGDEGGGWRKLDLHYPEIVEFVGKNQLEEGNQSWHCYNNVYSPAFVGGLIKL